MDINIDLNTDNDAFKGEYPVTAELNETVRILELLIEYIKAVGVDADEVRPLRDANGNTVGHYRTHPS